jgi:nucleoside 2-deoxyribosyltransferase
VDHGRVEDDGGGPVTMTTIYLAGPINGCTDEEAHGWRGSFMALLPGFAFLDPMARDYRGREEECVPTIVEGDKADIDACDIFFAYCWQVSWGTGMEILYAAERGKAGILVVPRGVRISPWLRYHSRLIVPTLRDAADAIRSAGFP